jgi:hypothetical protein
MFPGVRNAAPYSLIPDLDFDEFPTHPLHTWCSERLGETDNVGSEESIGG